MAEDRMRLLAGEQRKRLLAGLLGAVESSPWYSKLTQSERDAYRKEVIMRLGIYHDFMLDVLKIAQEDSMVNAHALELIEQVHSSQQRLERGLKAV